ncbi:hypothetical protein FH972_021047 [Carpinus fangiana]|uniref:Cytochrome b5 heme-binding domain-containing protein n=1 Tax=Carpinus fangiana TaxID=176857 RepID=A0A5N6KN77_9ROSI|nr:hypothetical protein FH972_021047 [Carpinus fangiana]
MGWLKGNQARQRPVETQHHVDSKSSSGVEHIEVVQMPGTSTSSASSVRQTAFKIKSPFPAELPFIAAEKVTASSKEIDGHGFPLVWVVVDDIVYDCSDFVHKHPGGATVIQSFAGKDCSWQFWRFHNPKIMKDEGESLMIGKTRGVENPFAEKPRFVGLRKLNHDDWD